MTANRRLIVTPSAERGLSRLPEKAAAAAIETLEAIAGNPRRLGKRLRLDLEGLYVARRGPYRIIYELDQDNRSISVVAIAHRADAYRRR